MCQRSYFEAGCKYLVNFNQIKAHFNANRHRGKNKNLIQNLYIRQISENEHYPTILSKMPPILPFKLKDMVNESILDAGHVFLGFTKDGQFIISYSLQVEADITVYPAYNYKLHWWYFVPKRPLRKASEVRLFGDYEISQDLQLLVCQWPSDEGKVLVFGYCTNDSGDQQFQQCYITITATPPLEFCPNCNGELDEETSSPLHCLQHSFTLHTKYHTVPPFPLFWPPVCLKIDGCALINTGDSLVALSVHVNAVSECLRNADGNRKSSQDLAASFSPCESDSSSISTYSTDSNVEAENVKRIYTKHEVYSRQLTCSLSTNYKRTTDQSPNSKSNISQNSSTSSQRQQKCVSYSSPDSSTIKRKSSDSDIVNDYFEDRKQSNNTPNSAVFIAETPTNSLLDSNTTDDKEVTNNGAFTVKMTSRIEAESRMVEPTTSCTVDGTCKSNHCDDYLFTDFVGSPLQSCDESTKENISPCQRIVSNVDHYYKSEKESIKVNDVANCTQKTVDALHSPSQSCELNSGYENSDSISRSLVSCLERIFIEGFDMVDDGDESTNSDYDNCLPIEVRGSRCERLRCLTQNNPLLTGHQNIFVKQQTFDVEQFVHEMALRLCSSSDKKYLAVNDYDIQIVDTEPETGDVIVLAVMLVKAATTTGQPKSLSYENSAFKVYQTALTFTWNLITGQNSVIGIEELIETEAPKENARWNPGLKICYQLRKKWSIPQPDMKSVKMLSNLPAVHGSSLPVICEPYHHVALVM